MMKPRSGISLAKGAAKMPEKPKPAAPAPAEPRPAVPRPSKPAKKPEPKIEYRSEDPFERMANEFEEWKREKKSR